MSLDLPLDSTYVYMRLMHNGVAVMSDRSVRTLWLLIHPQVLYVQLMRNGVACAVPIEVYAWCGCLFIHKHLL